MLSIPSSLVEEALAGMYRIASDKRVAFRGRIKHFQRMRFPAGTNTGKGKPATFTFTQLMQLVLAFELVQSGLAPAAAASVVSERWTEFGRALARTMVDDDQVEHDPAAFPGSELMFVIYFDAMWQLGAEGPVERMEYYGAVKVVLPEAVGEALTDENYANEYQIDSPWRALVIDAGWLVSTVLGFARDAGFHADHEDLFQDLRRADPYDHPYELKRVHDGNS